VNADVPGISPDFEGTGNQDGLASAFNEYGQLAFSAVFTDGSRGVFVTNAVAVPEPVMSFMSVLAASWLVSHRPRRALFAAASSWQKATNA